MGDLEAREYDEVEVKKIGIIWKYLKQGFKHKAAYQKAMEELNNPQLSLTNLISQ